MHPLYGPFAPGKSPFLVRGNIYLDIFASYDRRVPGGTKAVFAGIEDPTVRAFFAQTFEAGSNYDILPLMEIGQIAARICGLSWHDFVRANAAQQSEREVKGIYRLFFKMASPKMTIGRLPRVHFFKSFAFGSFEGDFESNTHFELVARGMPEPIIPWFYASAEGFVPTVLGFTGAKDIAVTTRPPEREGEREGMELATARVSVTWR